MNKTKKPTSSHTNYSSDKLITLIEFMSVQKEPVRLLDLANQLEMPSSTVFRFLNALINRDYVEQDAETGRYYLTFKLCGISDNIRSNSRLQSICLPRMQELSALTDETVYLCIEYNKMVMYIEAVNGSNKALISQKFIGHIAPMYCTGVGKLMLTNYTDQMLDYYVETKGLPEYCKNTITDVNELKKELIQVKNQGYAYDMEECEVGLCCIAAPIYDYTGSVIAGISISGPSVRMSKEVLNKVRDILVPVTKDISKQFGYVED